MKQEGDNGMGRVTVEVELTNHQDSVLASHGALAADKVRHVRVSGLVDTGASSLVVPKSVAVQLGVPPAGKTRVRYADQRKATRNLVSDVQVDLFGRQGTFTAIVEPNRTDLLIGAIVLEALDLLVDCRTQKLRPRDPDVIPHGDRIGVLQMKRAKVKNKKLPPGWTEEGIRELAKYYDNQSEAEQVAEHEAAYHAADQTVMVVPTELVPEIRKLIAQTDRLTHGTPDCIASHAA